MATAAQAVRAGGELALSRIGEPGYLQWRGPRDLLAGAVLDVQQRVADVIRHEFPDGRLLLGRAETPPDRDVGDEDRPERGDPLWMVDPLDGTLNFLTGLPVFAVSVAYRAEGAYRLGAVYDPCRDELFQAAVGGGASLNGRRIGVTQIADTYEALRSAMVGTDWTGSDDELRAAAQMGRFVASQVLAIRMLGSVALALCYVACGRLHAYYGLVRRKPWDMAAAVILGEAGGRVSDLDGEDLAYDGEGCLASNGGIHERMRGLVSSLRKMQRLDQEASAGRE